MAMKGVLGEYDEKNTKEYSDEIYNRVFEKYFGVGDFDAAEAIDS
jgi:hypothetical protein